MNTWLISVPCVGASTEPTGKSAGLARAADAYVDAGLTDQIRALGVGVSSSTRPVLPGEKLSLDPIVNLGRYNALVAKAVVDGISDGSRPLLAGGTCGHLIGMLAGLQVSYGPTARIGLIWLDAHGDFNTPRTTLSGMLGGMPVAVSAGLCLAPWRELAGMTSPIPTNRILLVDVRNLDPGEAELIKATDANIVKFGPLNGADAIASGIHRLAEKVDHLYLHVDADILDESLQPNHPTAEPDGPDLTAVHKVLRVAFATGKVRAFGVVSVNPTGPEGDISLRTGMDMIVGGVSAWSEFTSDV
jgi:arginase